MRTREILRERIDFKELVDIKESIESSFSFLNLFLKTRNQRYVRARSVFNFICLKDLGVNQEDLVLFYKEFGRNITRASLIHSAKAFKAYYESKYSVKSTYDNIDLTGIKVFTSKSNNYIDTSERQSEILEITKDVNDLSKENFNLLKDSISLKLKSFKWKSSFDETKIYSSKELPFHNL